jgi:peptide/nickel transport system substrate-binding protein
MSKSHVLRATAAAAVASAVMATAACGSNSGAAPAAQAPGVLVIDQAFTAQSIDPATIFQVTDSTVATGIYQTLLAYQGGVAEPKPLLASSYDVSPDAKTFTFKLDERAHFADGKKVTSDDVVFSLNRLKNLQSSPAYLMDGLTVSAPDEGTVVIKAKEAAPYLPHILTSTSTSIVDAEAVRKAGGTDAADASTKDDAGKLFTTPENGVGSGPYELAGYDTNSQITLVRNKDYWGGEAAYDKIVVRNVTNAQQQKSNVESGESQIAMDIPGRIADGMKSNGLTVSSSPSPEVLYLAMSNDATSPTSDPKVREAIKVGLDYDQLLTLAGAGAKRAAGIIPSKMMGALPESDAVKTDVEAAKALVKEAGATGKTITFDYANDYTRLAGIDYNVLAQGVQSQLEAIGLKVKLNPTPTSTSLQRYIDGKTQIALWSWPPDYIDPQNLLVFGPGELIGERNDWTAADDPEVSELGKKAQASTGADREAAYTAWNQALAKNGPYAYLLEPSFFLVYASALGTVTHDPMANLNLAQITR